MRSRDGLWVMGNSGPRVPNLSQLEIYLFRMRRSHVSHCTSWSRRSKPL